MTRPESHKADPDLGHAPDPEAFRNDGRRFGVISAILLTIAAISGFIAFIW